MNILKTAIMALAASVSVSQLSAADVRRQSLDGEWQFRQERYNDWYPAQVPGTVHTDLMANGLIDDPYMGLNERSVQWVDKEDWIYRTSFDVAEDVWASGNIDLVFEGLDTYADVYLNDSLILKADNMFRGWRVAVKDLLKEKDNELKVHFYSPTRIGLQKLEALPYTYEAINDQSQNGGLFDKRVSIFTRKAGYHYGWDWGPRLVTSGIWRPVGLEGWTDARVSDVYYHQTEVSSKKAVIDAEVEVIADKDMDKAVIEIFADGKSVAKVSKPLVKGKNVIGMPFTMKNPKLWWTRELGEPYLYDFETRVSCDGAQTSSLHTSVGIRSIVLDRSDEGTGKNFRFILNGVPVFMKGANYIPCDVFLPRVTDEIYRQTIEDAAAVNMNMLRVWGGGTYEDDRFYDLCDRYGILIWQDFMFACSIYPASGEWLESVKAEAEYNIRRLRNHACVALWCGNNECHDAWYGWGWDKRYAAQGHPEYDKIIDDEFWMQYHVVLPEMVSRFSPHTAYVPSSPYAEPRTVSQPDKGDMHNWQVWHSRAPFASYNTTKSRFFSEYGFQSFPGVESIKRFAPDSSVWRIDSDVMMSHQRGGSFANMRIAQYMEDEYWRPEDFEDFIYMSHVLQGDAIKIAIEAHRRDKPYCWGSLFWQHNDCWPVASWSSRDWYGCWKAQHYLAKYAYRDILVSPVIKDGKVTVTVVSDRLAKTKGELVLKVMDMQGKEYWSWSEPVTLEANSSKVFYDGVPENIGDPSEMILYAVFKTKDSSYDNICCFNLLKDMDLPEAEITYEIRQTGDGYEVELSSDSYARAVWLTIDGTDHHFSDNYFDILPGGTKTVSVKTGLTEEDFRSQLRIRHLAQTRESVAVEINPDKIVSAGYIGNGVQWDPYSLDYGKGRVEISDADKVKLYSRLDTMKPAFIRMMQNTTSQFTDGKFDPDKGLDHLSILLDYCQSRGVTVMFGDWGGRIVDAKAKTVNEEMIGYAAEYLRFLVEDKGYDCIKFYNLINEPNGYWSTSDGDFDLWSDAMLVMHRKMVENGIAEKVELVGPDAAIWTPQEAWWVTKSNEKLGDAIGLYDIHTYPSKVTINSGEYTDIISAYKSQVPEGKKIVMGEIGIKFVEAADSLYNKENIRRANECSFASKSDSQMFVYDPMYGTDMADAVLQTANAGYSGTVAWMLDDAMHTHETRDRLKIWGFWNIFGEEFFGAEQEQVRPWFYAWSLLCRYLPSGCDLNEVSVTSEARMPALTGQIGMAASCVKAASAEKDGKRSVFLVNVGKSPVKVDLSSSSELQIPDASVYVYGEGLFETEGDCTMLPDRTGVDADLASGMTLLLQPESLTVITNM